MRHTTRRNLLLGLICFLIVLLSALVALTFLLPEPGAEVPEATTQPTAQPTTAPPTTAPPTTTPPTTTPPTTAPATEAPTTEPPQPEHFTLSFVGDCTFANVNGRNGAKDFMKVVGENYGHPFADVLHIFENDDCTFVNLECVLTDRKSAEDKLYVYRGKPEYTAILTQNSVEFAGIANNHAFDCGKAGYEDMSAALEAAGIAYGPEEKTTLFTTESGLTIGVYSDHMPNSTSRVREAIASLRRNGAEVIVANFHWGTNYYYVTDSSQVKYAHLAIDAGADIVYGHHAHVLQRIEEYGDGIIFYGLGNFSYGGNKNPPDKDTAIVQQEVIRQLDGTMVLGQTTIIPCHMSGTEGYGNDFQPCPMEEGTKAYDRVLQKLDGTWPKDVLVVSYREDLFPTEATEAPPADAPATDTPATDTPATEAPTTDTPATEAPPVT